MGSLDRTDQVGRNRIRRILVTLQFRNAFWLTLVISLVPLVLESWILVPNTIVREVDRT